MLWTIYELHSVGKLSASSKAYDHPKASQRGSPALWTNQRSTYLHLAMFCFMESEILIFSFILEKAGRDLGWFKCVDPFKLSTSVKFSLFLETSTVSRAARIPRVPNWHPSHTGMVFGWCPDRRRPSKLNKARCWRKTVYLYSISVSVCTRKICWLSDVSSWVR